MDIVKLAYNLLGLTVPVTALFAFSLPLLHKIIGRRRFPGIYASIITCFNTFSTTIIALGVWKNRSPIVYPFGGWPPPLGIMYEVDYFNATLGLYVGWIMLAVIGFSLWIDRKFDEPEWYYTLIIGFEAGVLGCLYTGDLFNLFVMIEVLAISSYALTSYYKSKHEAIEAAFKYGILGATATTIYFLGLVIIYGFYGSLNMADILDKTILMRIEVEYYGYTLLNKHFIDSGIVSTTLALALTLWVFTFKSGLFPNHFWIPDVYTGSPTPVAAALSSVSEMIGVYATVRLLYTVFPIGSIIGSNYRSFIMIALMILGFISGVIGALMMMIQKNIRRLLAYSSISHIGLMFMILSIQFTNIPHIALKIAVIALFTHIVSHGLSKLTLFWSSEFFYDKAGTDVLDDMRGVGRRYPLASLAFITGFLNLIGAIPFIGFYSKLLMYQSFIEAGNIPAAIGVVVITALSIPGYAKAIYTVVFATPSKDYGGGDSRIGLVIAVLAFLTLAIGLAYGYLYRLLYDSPFTTSITSYHDYLNAFINTKEQLRWSYYVSG
ncbi:MAG: proton-conducting transporter membrane subunit [Desulfurococcaceae archaeon]